LKHLTITGVSMLLWACAQGDLSATDGGLMGIMGELGCNQAGAELGQCDGNWLIFCFEGEARRLDCTLVDAQCGYDPIEAVNRCLPPGQGEPPRQPASPDPPPPDPVVPPTAPPVDPPSEEEDPPPPGGPCDGVADGRRCDGDVVLICRNGAPAGRTNCAANGLICDVLADGNGGCQDPNGSPEGPEGPPGLPMGGTCGGLPVGSRCERDFVVSCRDGLEESRFDCGSQGQQCDQFDAQWAGCEGGNNPPPPQEQPDPQPAGCGDVPFWGQCTGDIYEVCNLFNDEVITIDCSFLGAYCGPNADGLIGCNWQ